jgi:hypothetical protein
LYLLNQVSASNNVNCTPKADFAVDGAQKSFAQITDLGISYLAIDDVLVGRMKKIPLWFFAFYIDRSYESWVARDLQSRAQIKRICNPHKF